MAEIDTSQVVALERQLNELTTNPKFIDAFKAARDIESQLKDGWKRIEGAMVLAGKKKLTGDWGYVTLVPRTTIKVLDRSAVPEKYLKLMPDLKAIGDDYKLTNVLPPGVIANVTTHLRKGIK